MDLAQRRYRDALKILASLEGAGHEARLAGGCVRDRVLGIEPNDYDVATTAAPDKVLAHFKAEGMKVIPTGLQHGTVTVVMPTGPVEITTLRHDVATDGRRAAVAFGAGFEEDALRRDFTINAMFEDARGVIHDYYHGQADLKQGILRFVGDPGQRIREDYLRILRLFRFWARFGFAPVAGTLDAIRAHLDGLAALSQERITAELIKTLGAKAPVAPLVALHETGVLRRILPELGDTHWLTTLKGDTYAPLAVVAAPVRGFAVFVAVINKNVFIENVTAAAMEALGLRLKLATNETRYLVFGAEAPRLLAALGPETADLLDFVDAAEAAGGFASFFQPLLQGAPSLAPTVQRVANAEAAFGHRRVAKLPIDGALLMRALHLPPGPALGLKLTRLRRSYRNGEWTSADEGLAWINARP